MKRMKIMEKFFAAIVSLTMLFAGAVPAFAAETTGATLPVSGGKITFTKKIVYDTNAHVPNVTFSYTIGYGSADKSQGIFAGDDVDRVTITSAPTVGSAVFTPNTNKKTENTNNNVETGNASNVAKKEVTIDLSGISFERPGIYRFTLKENEVTKKGLTRDSDVRNLDVYVLKNNNSNTYEVNSVLERQNRSDSTSKGDSFESKYTTYPVTFKKEVSGNQADPKDEFKFTLNISNADDGTIYDVYKGETYVGNMTASPQGTATLLISDVKASDEIVIRGIAQGSNVAVTEDGTVNKTLGYTPEKGNTTGDQATASVSDNGITLTISSLTQTSTAVIKNTKEGTVPTGIIFAVAPFAIGAVAIAAFVILKVRKAAKQ